MPLFLHCFYFRSYQPITKIFPCCTSKKNIGRTWFQIVLESPLEEYEENQQKKQSGIKAFISIWIKTLNIRGIFRARSHSFKVWWHSFTLAGPHLGVTRMGRRRRRGGSDWADRTPLHRAVLLTFHGSSFFLFLHHVQKETISKVCTFLLQNTAVWCSFLYVIILGVCYWQNC